MTMKYFMTILVCAALLMTACHTDTENRFTWKKATADKQVPLCSDKDSPTCSVHLELHYAETPKAPEVATEINDAIEEQLLDFSALTMQQAADSFATQYAANYRRNLLPLYREDQGDPDKCPWYEYRYTIETNTAEGRGNVAIYKATVDYYEGGAHGINQLLTLNFDTQTGKLYRLQDVFVAGYEYRLNELLLNALLEQTDCMTVDELRKKGYLYSMDMFASENFMLGTDAITFVYNPYEIASYSMGKTELTINYGDLEEILKKE